VIDAALVELAALTSTKRACGLLGKSRATHYRRQQPKPTRPRATRPAPRNKLTVAERAAVLATLNHESFVDKSVPLCLSSGPWASGRSLCGGGSGK
jgi:putative transposase